MFSEIREAVEDAHIGAGVIFNCLLLYAIRRFTRTALGSYKQLLTIFAAFDTFLCVLHASSKPKVVIIGTTMGLAGNIPDRDIMGLYSACFSVPFALMNIHFLYRFWAIRFPHLIPLFSNKKFICIIMIILAAEFTAWFLLITRFTIGEGAEKDKALMSAETFKRFGINLTEGWILLSYWENETFHLNLFLTLIFFDVIIIASFTVAISLGGLTYYYIHKTDKISQHSRNLQQRLLIAVCAQTAVPFIFVYIPSFCVLNFPFFRIPRLYLDDACTVLTSCFPAWDAVIMILLMKEYREGLFGIIVKKKPVEEHTTKWMTSVAVPSTVPE